MSSELQQVDGPSALRSIAADVGLQWFTDLAEYAIVGLGDYSETAIISALTQAFETGQPAAEFLSADDGDEPERAEDEVLPAEPSEGIEHLRFERVGPFTDFRRLGESLTLQLEKNITLVFGRNGSGKSSVCMALRCLAKDSQPPGRMRHMNASTTTPSFKFRLEGQDSDQTWAATDQLGTFSRSMMYFDGAIAHSLIRDPAKPEQAVNVEPFRLEVIKECGTLLGILQDSIAAEVLQRSDETAAKLEVIRTACEGIEFLSKTKQPDEQARWLKELAATSVSWDEEKDAADVDEKRAKYERLKRLLTPEKQVRLAEDIQTDKRHIKAVKDIIKQLRPIASSDEQAIEQSRLSKTEAMNQMLATDLDSDEAKKVFVGMLDAANEHRPLSSELNVCPLCEQPLQASAKTRFDKYKDLLASSLKVDIDAAAKRLKALKRSRDSAAQAIAAFDSSWLSEFEEITDADIDDSKSSIQQELAVSEGSFNASENLVDIIRKLRVLAVTVAARRRSAQSELDDLKAGAEQTNREIAETEEAIRDLLSRQFRSRYEADCSAYTQSKEAHDRLRIKSERASWQGMRTKLSTQRRNITEDLAKAGFSQALDSEYKTITDGYGIDHFGVVIGTETAQQTTQFTQAIGTTKCDLPDVLSEGEQRLHATAMFFAEAGVSKPDVLVFDDPSVSFDYNYVDGVSARIWNYAFENQDSQIVVFTHSWEFFFKAYEIFMYENSFLSSKLEMSFLELEECAAVQGHKDKLPAQNQKVQAGLNALGDPDTVDATRAVCLDIRLLVEEVVLKLLFNGQRQGFRTRRPATLKLDAYTKLQRLTEDQASALAGVNRTVSDWLHSRSDDASAKIPSKTKLITAYETVERVRGELEKSLKKLADDS